MDLTPTDCFGILVIYGHLLSVFDLFWDLTICNQPIWRCIWLILEFLNLRSCIFWSFIDRIWGFTIYSHAFSAFCLTAFGVFYICGQIFPGFSWLHLAFSRFAVMHSQLIPWFCLTYLNIFPYAVNSGLVQQKLSCSYIDNERFLLTQDMEIRRRDDITTQLLQNSNKSLSNLWIIQQTVNFQSSLNSKPSIIILHRPF